MASTAPCLAFRVPPTTSNSLRGHTAGPAPTEDNLLVFYLPDREAWQRAVDRMMAAVPIRILEGTPVAIPVGGSLAGDTVSLSAPTTQTRRRSEARRRLRLCSLLQPLGPCQRRRDNLIQHLL